MKYGNKTKSAKIIKLIGLRQLDKSSRSYTKKTKFDIFVSLFTMNGKTR